MTFERISSVPNLPSPSANCPTTPHTTPPLLPPPPLLGLIFSARYASQQKAAKVKSESGKEQDPKGWRRVTCKFWNNGLAVFRNSLFWGANFFTLLINIKRICTHVRTDFEIRSLCEINEKQLTFKFFELSEVIEVIRYEIIHARLVAFGAPG